MSELTLLVLLKVAYLATGLTLSLVGKRLIENKLETKFESEGAVSKNSFKIITTSPGLVFLVAGFVIIAVAIFQHVQINESHKQSTIENNQLKLEPKQNELSKLQHVQNKEPHKRSSVKNNQLRSYKKQNESSYLQHVHNNESHNPSTIETNQLRSATIQNESSYIQTLVEKSRTISFAVENDRLRLVKDELSRAKSLAAVSKIDEAAVHLATAIVIQPSSVVEIASEPAFAAVLQQPQFKIIAQARFQLPLHTINVPKVSYSPIAEELIERLKTLSNRKIKQDNATLEAKAIVLTLPNKSGIEPKDKTIRKLLKILDNAPAVLLKVLNGNDRGWLLTDVDIMNALLADVDRRIQNE